jgi:hypothetical protein
VKNGKLPGKFAKLVAPPIGSSSWSLQVSGLVALALHARMVFQSPLAADGFCMRERREEMGQEKSPRDLDTRTTCKSPLFA